MGFSRQEYWSGLPCPPPGILPTQRSNPPLFYVSCIGAGRFFTTSATWEAHDICISQTKFTMFSALLLTFRILVVGFAVGWPQKHEPGHHLAFQHLPSPRSWHVSSASSAVSLPCSWSWPYYNPLSALTGILQQCSNCPLCFLPPFFIIYPPPHSLTVIFKFKCIHFST